MYSSSNDLVTFEIIEIISRLEVLTNGCEVCPICPACPLCPFVIRIYVMNGVSFLKTSKSIHQYSINVSHNSCYAENIFNSI